jgi:hypothetical protein
LDHNGKQYWKGLLIYKLENSNQIIFLLLEIK